MQNLEIQQFANKVALTMPDTINRRICLPYLIGMAIGSFLQVKIGHDGNAQTAFSDAHLGNVSRFVSYMNEQMIMDVTATIAAARSTYLIRHRIANGVPTDYAANPEFDLMAVAFGFSQIMPVEIYTTITKTGMAANQVYTAALMMIAKLKETNIAEL